MAEQLSEMLVKIDAPDLDDNELADLARLLQGDIGELDVESVEPVKGGAVPDGAMPVEWYEIGVLSIKLATAVLPPLILAVKSWLDRQDDSRKATSKKDEWKVKIGFGSFSIDIGRSTTKQEIVDKTKEIQKQIESK